MATLADDREKRLAELKKEVTRRGFDRHASLLKSISDLPVELQSSAVIALSFRETIQTVISFPPQIQRGWHYVPKQALLFTTDGVIHLVASIWPDEEPQVTCLKECGLLYMKVTLLLLYGLLEIVAEGERVPARLNMEFNTVSWYYLSSPVQRFLLAPQAASAMPEDEDKDSVTTRQTLERLPIKFSNGLKIYGLLPGEKLREAVFQTGTWERQLFFFRRPVLGNTLLMLTSHYLVVIQEDLEVRQGWIISYIPRHNITGIKKQPCDLWNELSISLKRGNQSIDYKLKLKSETAEAWRQQWILQGGSWEDLPERP